MAAPDLELREFTAQQKYREITRELAQREDLYRAWSPRGGWPLPRADRRIALLRDIARDYAARHEMLFGEELRP